MSTTTKHCYPKCNLFRCGQRALTYQGPRTYCRWADDRCTGGTCNYAICIKSRLLPDGICGLTIKRKTREEHDFDSLEEPKIKLKGKMRRRFREEDLI